MGVMQNIRTRFTAMRLGLSIIGEGFGFPGQGLAGLISQALQPRWGEPPKRNSKQWLELAGKTPRLRPVYKIAKDVAASEWELYVYRNGSKKEEVDQHPLIDLLMRPNPKMTGYTLMYLTEMYLQLRGEGGWLVERNGLRTPAELWPIPPHWVIDTPSANRPYFTVSPQGAVAVTLHIAPEDVVWFTEPDPVNPYGRGLGPAEGIGDEVETDEYMAKWAKRFFFNDARPPIVIQAPGADKATAERLKEEWMERYSGYSNAHKPAVLPWDAKLQELGKAQKEMDFVKSRQFLRDVSNQHFFIPPEVMGIVENSNRATIDAADYLYAKNVLKPALDLIQEQIQVQLCPEFDEKLIFEFENPVPEDDEFALKVSNDGLQRGALTVDEWRQANGYDPDESGAGNVYYVPINVIPSPTPGGGETRSGAGGGEEDNEGGKAAKGLTPDQKTAIWRQFDKAAFKHERAMVNTLKRYFQAQQDEVTRRLEEIFGDKAAAKDASDTVSRLANWTVQMSALVALITPHMVASAEEGHGVANDTFSLGISWDLIRPEMVQWARENAAEKVKSITNTTRSALRATLEEGILRGESVPKLRARVSEVYADAKGRRAVVIARTETHNSVVHGTFATYGAADVQRKEWLTTRDGRERPSHAALDGEVQDIAQRFSNNLMYPGDAAGPAEEVIQCRCALLPVID